MNQNILQLCLSPDLGGLELYMQRISSYLKDKTNVTCVVNEKGKLPQALKKENINYIPIKRQTKLMSFMTSKTVSKIIDEKDIDIIHIHWTKDLHIAVMAKLSSKKQPKLVQTRHMHMTRFKNDFYHNFLYQNVDLMIAVTEMVQEQIETFIPENIRPKVVTSYIGAPIPRIIDENEKITIRQEYNLQDSFTVGIVGRIEEAKGQYLVIDAIKKLKHEDIDTKALIIGHAMDEKYLDKLKNNIKKDGIEDNIIFTGFTNKVQELMQVCDVVVLATKKETFGLVLIEAMQCGVAVIGSNKGGPVEIIEDGKSGLLFQSGDSEDLKSKIKYLCLNTKKKEDCSQNGKLRTETYFNDNKQFFETKKLLETLER